MSGRFAQSIRLEITPSQQLGRVLLFVYAGAILAPWFVIHSVFATLLLAALLLNLLSVWRRYVCLEHPASIVEMSCSEESGWRLLSASNDIITADLLPAAYVTPWLTVMRFRSRQRRYSVILLADNARADEFRRLRVWLRWKNSEVEQQRLL